MLNRKKRIFIASATESLKIAKEIETYLKSNLNSEEYEYVIWSENFYELSDTTYNQLVSKAISFDYGVFVCGLDDLSIRNNGDQNEKVNHTARGNVYWEYGLFVGVLSYEKVFCVCHEQCKLASDLEGNNVIKYVCDEKGNMGDSEVKLRQLKDSIIRSSRCQNISLLSTTSLAINYFYNFVEPLAQKLDIMELIENNSKNYYLGNKKINIVIPTNIEENMRNYAFSFNAEHKLLNISVPSVDEQNRNISFKCVEKQLTKNTLEIYDVPTVLESAFRTVDYVMSVAHIGDTIENEKAKIKAIDDFCQALMIQVNKSRSARKYVNIVYDSEILVES